MAPLATTVDEVYAGKVTHAQRFTLPNALLQHGVYAVNAQATPRCLWFLGMFHDKLRVITAPSHARGCCNCTSNLSLIVVCGTFLREIACLRSQPIHPTGPPGGPDPSPFYGMRMRLRQNVTAAMLRKRTGAEKGSNLTATNVIMAGMKQYVSPLPSIRDPPLHACFLAL